MRTLRSEPAERKLQMKAHSADGAPWRSVWYRRRLQGSRARAARFGVLEYGSPRRINYLITKTCDLHIGVAAFNTHYVTPCNYHGAGVLASAPLRLLQACSYVASPSLSTLRQRY